MYKKGRKESFNHSFIVRRREKTLFDYFHHQEGAAAAASPIAVVVRCGATPSDADSPPKLSYYEIDVSVCGGGICRDV